MERYDFRVEKCKAKVSYAYSIASILGLAKEVKGEMNNPNDNKTKGRKRSERIDLWTWIHIINV